MSLDGQAAGQAPLTLATTPGRHLVEVTKEGFSTYSEWVDVKAGERRPVPVTLRRVAPPPPTPAAPPPPSSSAAAVPSAAAAPAVPRPTGCTAEMVRVFAGRFQMGSSGKLGEADERPQREVTLSTYCLDKTEVTVKSYATCVAAGGCTALPRTPSLNGFAVPDVRLHPQFCNYEDRPNHPANCVDWHQATAYCTWASKRLPTEAEWEFAARGADGRAYPWGNDAPQAARVNACGTECAAMWANTLRLNLRALYDATDGWQTTAPVGGYPSGLSAAGVLDMAGNVWEWTSDWFGDYTAAPATNPRGMSAGTARVTRGGGWSDRDAGALRTAYRNAVSPTYQSDSIGFRCARTE